MRDPLLAAHRFLRRGPVNEEGWSQLVAKDGDWERSYRGRWAHDSGALDPRGELHGLVLVERLRQGWADHLGVAGGRLSGDRSRHARVRAARLPPGASISWYEYSPLRLKYPYVRASLLQMFREARERLGDPVEAWAEIVDDPEKARLYRRQRGKGGFVRASWDEAVELIAAAHVHTIKRYGPDRCVGFTPIPAMSMAPMPRGRGSCR